MNRLLILTGLGLTLLLVPSCGTALPTMTPGVQSSSSSGLTIVGETHLIVDDTDSQDTHITDVFMFSDKAKPEEQAALDAKVQHLLTKVVGVGKVQATVEVDEALLRQDPEFLKKLVDQYREAQP